MPEQRNEYLFKRARHKETGRVGLITCAYENLYMKVLLTVRTADKIYFSSPLKDWIIVKDEENELLQNM